MRINTNIVSQRTQENLRLNQENLSSTMNRLSSGKRINSSADDAAGLAVSTRMSVKSSGLGVASRNSSDGISLLETAESAMNSITNILQRMRDLTLSASTGTLSGSDKALYQKEFNQLVNEINHIASTTNFNGIQLMSAATTLHIQASDQGGDGIAINLKKLTATALMGLASTTTIDISSGTVGGVFKKALASIDAAITTMAGTRADLGATLSRLDFNVTNLNNQKINTDASNSRIMDADMAAETSEMTKAKIFSEASVSMLSQANQTPQMVSKLLQ